MSIDEVVAYFVEVADDGRATSIGHYYDAAPLTMAIMAAAQSPS